MRGPWSPTSCRPLKVTRRSESVHRRYLCVFKRVTLANDKGLPAPTVTLYRTAQRHFVGRDWLRPAPWDPIRVVMRSRPRYFGEAVRGGIHSSPGRAYEWRSMATSPDS